MKELYHHRSGRLNYSPQVFNHSGLWRMYMKTGHKLFCDYIVIPF